MLPPETSMSISDETAGECPPRSSVGRASGQLVEPTLSINHANTTHNIPATSTASVWNQHHDSILRTVHDQDGMRMDVVAAYFFPDFSVTQLFAILPEARDRLMRNAQSTRAPRLGQVISQQPQMIRNDLRFEYDDAGNVSRVFSSANQNAQMPTQQFTQALVQQHAGTGVQWDAHTLTQQQEVDRFTVNPSHTGRTQSSIDWNSHTPVWQPSFGGLNSTSDHAVQQASLQQNVLPSTQISPQSYMQQPYMQQLNVQELYMQQPSMQQPNMQQLNVQQPNMEELNMQQSNMHQSSMQQLYMQQLNMAQANVQQPNMEELNMQQPNMQQPNMQQPNTQQSYIQHPPIPPQLILPSQHEENNLDSSFEELFNYLEAGLDGLIDLDGLDGLDGLNGQNGPNEPGV